jgi:hypothetical protein
MVPSWSAVARGAVISILRDQLSKKSNPSVPQQRAIGVMAEVTGRISKFSYGTVARIPTSNLSDVSALDDIKYDPDGTETAARMDWYLQRVSRALRISISLVLTLVIKRARL